MAVSSPCRNQCTLDAARRACTACGRTLAEIAAWGSLSEDERRAIMARLPARRAAAASGASGRADA